MNKYVATLLFYVISFAVIYLLNTVSPNQQDGGLGFGSLAIILFVVVLIVLVGVNAYRGLKRDKSYFLLAGIHVLVLLVMISRLFM